MGVGVGGERTGKKRVGSSGIRLAFGMATRHVSGVRCGFERHRACRFLDLDLPLLEFEGYLDVPCVAQLGFAAGP